MRDSTRVLVFPAFLDNPYLDLMQIVPDELGFEFVRVRKPKDLYAAAEKLERGDVFHLHWTVSILQRARDADAARAALERFTGLLDRLAERGVHLVWTVHNRLPHDLAYLEPELALNRMLADRADLIHVLSGQTPEVVADVFTLPPDRVRFIPHPSYEGVYGPPRPANEARARLGVAPDEPTVLFFGRMRAYKGLDTLLAALSRIAESGETPPTLLLAGRAKPDERAEVERMLPSGPRIIPHFDFVDAAELRDWFDAADVAVFPFRSVLNSGSVHLSATLGRPVILPGEPHLREQFGAEPWVRFFDVAEPVTSLATLLTDPDHGDHTAAIEDFNRRHAPRAISRQYADLLLELVGSAVRTVEEEPRPARRLLRRRR